MDVSSLNDGHDIWQDSTYGVPCKSIAKYLDASVAHLDASVAPCGATVFSMVCPRNDGNGSRDETPEKCDRGEKVLQIDAQQPFDLLPTGSSVACCLWTWVGRSCLCCLCTDSSRG